jgi:hypothetical protein
MTLMEKTMEHELVLNQKEIKIQTLEEKMAEIKT